MEPKAKTLQERFGFVDSDLKTPKHDAIMFWLDTEMPAVLSQLFWEPKWEYEDWFVGQHSTRDIPKGGLVAATPGLKERIDADLGIAATIPKRSIAKVWECPILDRARNGAYTIGFADMFVRWKDQHVGCTFKSWSPHEYVKSEIVFGLDNGVYFEVKPSVPSLGELIRQLRMYRTYTDRDYLWVVVSPDTRFSEKIQEQGFGFVAVPQALTP
jgi:hypothetical protein